MVKKLLMLMMAVFAVITAMGQEKSYDLCHYKDGAVVYRTAVSDVDSIAFAESDSAARVNDRLLLGVWYGCGSEIWYDDTNSKFSAEEEHYTSEFRVDGKVYTADKWRADTTKYRVEGKNLFIGGFDYTIEKISEDSLKYSYVQEDTKNKVVLVLSRAKPVLASDSDEADYVDLGLPSGTLWATHNVGANSPEGYGYYFLWGQNTYYESNRSLYGWLLEGLTYSDLENTGYIDEGGNLMQSADYVRQYEGEGWKMPTKAEFEELLALPHAEFKRNGIPGYLFLGNNGHTLFLPNTGQRNIDKELFGRASIGYYWTSTAMMSGKEGYAYSAKLWEGEGTMVGTYGDKFLPIRAVKAEKTENKNYAETMDLGLPSGTLWADRNVGASKINDRGTEFNWTEWSGFDDDNDAAKNGAIDAKGKITEAYDIATANWGSDWRMPTDEEIEELLSLENYYYGLAWIFKGKNGNTLKLPCDYESYDSYDDHRSYVRERYFSSNRSTIKLYNFSCYGYQGYNGCPPDEVEVKLDKETFEGMFLVRPVRKVK